MYELPTEPRKIRERIKRYERKLREEKKKWGSIRDGAGKRYLLGPLYLLMDDLDGALKSLRWFEEECPDDSGEPGQYLCWALALYRSGNEKAATHKLRQAMLQNIYLIPRLLGERVEPFDMWHGSSDEEPWYIDEIPPEFFSLWSEDEQEWAARLFHSDEFRALASRYVEIHKEFLSTPPSPKRTRLVRELFRMKE